MVDPPSARDRRDASGQRRAGRGGFDRSGEKSRGGDHLPPTDRLAVVFPHRGKSFGREGSAPYGGGQAAQPPGGGKGAPYPASVPRNRPGAPAPSATISSSRMTTVPRTMVATGQALASK